VNQSLSDSPLRRPIPSIQGPPLEALFRQQLEKTITDADGDHRGKFLHDTRVTELFTIFQGVLGRDLQA
jgi:hypothetical protein